MAEYAFFIGAEFTAAVLLFATGVLAIRPLARVIVNALKASPP